MSMMTMVLHNPLIPVVDPLVTRTFLSCTTSRVTITRVRTLREIETERCGRMRLTPPHPQAWDVSITMPIAISMTLA